MDEVVKEIDNSWRLTTVEVSGLLEEKDVRWELDPEVNILGGPNGSGKSTLLRALVLQFAREEGAGQYSEAIFGKIHSTLADGVQLNARKLVEVVNTPEAVEEKITLEVSNVVPVELREVSKRIKVLYIEAVDPQVILAIKGLPTSTFRERPTTTVLDLRIENELNKRNALFSRYLSAAMDGGDEEEVSRLRDIFGRFSYMLRQEFMTDYEIKDMASMKLAKENNPEKEIPFHRLSAGEKQLIYLLLSVNNTMEDNTILLLDEADMGMHVDWKKKLIRCLRKLNPNMQMIAATHSPALVYEWMDNVKEIGQLTVKENPDEKAEE